MSTSSPPESEPSSPGPERAAASGTLSADHPNLKLAATRLQRVQWVWAGLFAGMAVLTWTVIGQTYPLAALPWLVAAGLLATMLQPAFLALTALLWVLSLIVLIPGMGLVFGPDPISEIFAGGTIETLGRAAVRVVLAIVAWNQFIFYRMLYGTEGTVGLPEDQPHIPEVVTNRADSLASISALLGGAASIMALTSIGIGTTPAGHSLVQLAYHGSIFALGFGLGAAFSPTSKRRWALIGTFLGVLGFLISVAAGRLILA